jgi:hypothetical protein
MREWTMWHVLLYGLLGAMLVVAGGVGAVFFLTMSRDVGGVSSAIVILAGGLLVLRYAHRLYRELRGGA